MRDGLIQTDNVSRAAFAVAELRRRYKAGSRRNLMVGEGLRGRGKTFFGECHYVQDANTIYLEADPDWRAAWLMRDVAQALGLPRERSLEKNKLQIIAEQGRRFEQGRPVLLIIDEANRLLRSFWLLETLRGLHDKARLPLVLLGESGEYGLLNSITRKSPRFADRITQVVPFRDVTAAEIESAARHLGDMVLPPGRAAEIQARAEGNFRIAINILEELESVMQANPGQISEAKLAQAVKNLQLAEAREQKRRAAGGA